MAHVTSFGCQHAGIMACGAIIALVVTTATPVIGRQPGSPAVADRSVAIKGRVFLIDGKPTQILSGEMHYARIPREYWRDRLKKARAMGLNTISTYVFWNLHEPKPGAYDFSGNLDIATYIRTAQEEGLHVILRPGPYVCAEWDLGGFPAWLLADRAVVLRSTDATFMKAATKWLHRLGQELAPLQYPLGGPIIAVQVENEYGSFDKDTDYMRAIRDAIVSGGLGQAQLYTADGPGQLPMGTLPDLPAVVNFGPGGAEKAFAALRDFRPDTPAGTPANNPLMSGEYWAGWFDQWGLAHHTTDGVQQARELDWMLAQQGSFNLYMFHGGTTFGFMNGANMDRAYRPQTTSYDYDAALDEAGRPQAKYFTFRDTILTHFPGLTLPPVPTIIAPLAIPRFDLTESASLFGELETEKAVRSEQPKTMEELGQSYGYVLYRTMVNGPVKGELVINDLHDFAVVFVNQRRVATMDRRLNQNRATIDLPLGTTMVDILVENTGRINFKKDLRTDRKGITESATFQGRELIGWQMFPLPMSDVSKVHFSPAAVSGPAFHRGHFTLTLVADTFLDLRGWEKGVVWVNGHNLGRVWNIGPQQTLYVPGAWLHRGRNEVVVFDLGGHTIRSVAGLVEPVLNEVHGAGQ